MSERPDILVAPMGEDLSSPVFDAPSAVTVMIGTRGHLTASDAEETAQAMAALVTRNGCPISLCIGGYDDDPRELHAIPEAMAYWRLVLNLLGQLVDIQPILPRFTPDTINLTYIAFGRAKPLPPSPPPMSRHERRKRQAMQRRTR